MDLLIDGSSVWARAYFAVARASDGDPRPTTPRAVESALRTLAILLRGPAACRLPEPATGLLVAWDSPDGTAKKSDKGHRPPKPADYYEGRRELRRAIRRFFGATQVSAPAGLEADDLLASATLGIREGERAVVVTADKDLHQLVGRRGVGVYCLKDKQMITREAVCERYGIARPSHLAVFLALVGDKVDGIDGVAGVGPVKARRLLEGIGPKDRVQEAAARVNERLKPSERVAFAAALGATILDFYIEGIPAPAPVVLTDPEELGGAGYPGARFDYRELVRERAGGESDEEWMERTFAAL